MFNENLNILHNFKAFIKAVIIIIEYDVIIIQYYFLIVGINKHDLGSTDKSIIFD